MAVSSLKGHYNILLGVFRPTLLGVDFSGFQVFSDFVSGSRYQPSQPHMYLMSFYDLSHFPHIPPRNEGTDISSCTIFIFVVSSNPPGPILAPNAIGGHP